VGGGAVNAPPPLSGLLVLDKPEGKTSFHLVYEVRRRLVAGGAPKRVKVGHGGTLDPLATGLVVILVGKATKLCDRIMLGRKRYVAGVDLSRVSTTDDREGEIRDVAVAVPPTREQVAAAARAFLGTIQQRPPAHSAIWVDGRRAYDMARKGQDPDLPARPVEIHYLSVLDYHWPRATLDVVCGKGMYVRSLARDLGAALGVGGMLISLRRTEAEPFTIEQARRMDELPAVLRQEDLMDAEEWVPKAKE
jgi:tRNA pseudouridine55 synthase